LGVRVAVVVGVLGGEELDELLKWERGGSMVDEWVGFMEGVERRSAPGEVSDSEGIVRMVDMIAFWYDVVLKGERGRKKQRRRSWSSRGLCRVVLLSRLVA
jgi:hypothetical protein